MIPERPSVALRMTTKLTNRQEALGSAELMNAFQLTEYFRTLDWCLWQIPGRQRGGWRLSPLSEHDQAKSFPSLNAAWAWWRLRIRRAMLVERSFDEAIRMCRNRQDTQAQIHRWALSEGIEELPDDIEFEIIAPYLAISHKERRSISRAAELASSAWAGSSTDIFPRIIRWMHEEERKTLSNATAVVGAQTNSHRRI